MTCPSGFKIQVRDGLKFKSKASTLDVTCNKRNGGFYWSEAQTTDPEHFFQMDLTCQESSQAGIFILVVVAIIVILLILFLLGLIFKNKTKLFTSRSNKEKANKFSYSIEPTQNDELGGLLSATTNIDSSTFNNQTNTTTDGGGFIPMEINSRNEYEMANKSFINNNGNNKSTNIRDSGMNQTDMHSSGRGSALFDSPSSNLGNQMLQSPNNIDIGPHLDYPKALEFDFISPRAKTLYNKLINYDKLEQFYDSKTIGDFESEFTEIPKKDVKKLTTVAKNNEFKSRYSDIDPYDFNRVKLPNNGFINASNVLGFTNRRYIAAMGPKTDTVQDFWSMIWNSNVSVIVMLTNF